jgi:hypothetical protein
VASEISSLANSMRDLCCEIRLREGYWGPESDLVFPSADRVESLATRIKELGMALFKRGGEDYMLLAFKDLGDSYDPRMPAHAASALATLDRFEQRGWAYSWSRVLCRLALTSTARLLVAYLWQKVGEWRHDEQTASVLAESVASDLANRHLDEAADHDSELGDVNITGISQIEAARPRVQPAMNLTKSAAPHEGHGRKLAWRAWVRGNVLTLWKSKPEVTGTIPPGTNRNAALYEQERDVLLQALTHGRSESELTPDEREEIARIKLHYQRKLDSEGFGPA